jgi:antagonist of KipI
MPALTVVRPGMLTTVQDLGRWGQQDSGVPVAGPMDAFSHCRANRLAGNGDECATLEITLMGPELEADGPVVCATSGARFDVMVNGIAVAAGAAFAVPAGARLRFGSRRDGARAYLAVQGGFDVAPVFGSRATSVISRMGPFGGRPLKAGDRLPVGAAVGPTGAAVGRTFRFAETGADALAVGEPLALPVGGARLRVLLGPHDWMFSAAAIDALFGSRYLVTPQSNRMGYRLEGAALTHVDRADILSDATPMGSLQVPASGQPILLMADRQTTGGYPKIATVISADLPLAGQLAPGDWIEFVPCSRDEAIAALRALDARLAGS